MEKEHWCTKIKGTWNVLYPGNRWQVFPTIIGAKLDVIGFGCGLCTSRQFPTSLLRVVPSASFS
eukprot:9178824-Prorocentrum_lima.AAC.1